MYILKKLNRQIRKVWARYAHYLYKKRSLYAVPTQLGICLTHQCNIRCPYCMRENFKPPKGEMTLANVKRLMRRMPYINGVCIMGLCEPLLNPETPDIIRWLKDEGEYTLSLTTNGMVDIDDNMLDALLRVGDMVFSVDTSDPETFKFLRGGAVLDRVLANLERVLKFKRDRGLGRMDNPPIHINAVMTTHNFHQFPDLLRMLEPYAAELTYLMIDPVTRPDFSRFEPFHLDREKYMEFVPRYRELAKKSPLQVVGFDWMFKDSTRWEGCHLSWISMFIEPNGDAYFCYNYENVLGNVFRENPRKVWNSPAAREFRKKLLSPDPPVLQCRSCNFARPGWQPEGVYNKKCEDVEP